MIDDIIAHERILVKVSAARAGQCQTFFVASVRSPVDARRSAWESYTRIAEELKQGDLEIVHERVFGNLRVRPGVMAERHRAFRRFRIPSSNPVTYIQGSPPWGEGFAGAIIRAVSSEKPGHVWTIMDGGHPCGRGWRRNGSAYLILQNIMTKHGGSQNNESRAAQVRTMLDRAERILRESGALYSDVVRTWFYLSDILDWYPEFNKARNEKYGEFGIMPDPGDGRLLLPASTGIQGITPSGAAATMDLIAIIGDPGVRPGVKQMTNTAQLDAFRYGSAFSRGTVIQEGDFSLLEISGSAAVGVRGKSQFHGNIRRQISCTFEKIERLLGQEAAGPEHIVAATVFVKRPEYAAVFWEMARDRGLEDIPAVCVVADVCRDDLLFEIDGEAVLNGGIK